MRAHPARTVGWILLLLLLSGCLLTAPNPTPTAAPTPPPSTPTLTPGPMPTLTLPPVHVARPLFQIFILTPVTTCLAGNDFYSGSLCRGEQCGDCDCDPGQFDPPLPMTGVPPERINDPQYASYRFKECVEISLTPAEVDKIIADMRRMRDQVLEWSGGTLDLQMEFTVLPHTHTGFVAQDFVFGTFEIDDELLNTYVTPQTDFVYTVFGAYDRTRNLHLAYWCGGAYGELSVRGAGYATIQYNDVCNSVTIAGQTIYEPLIHEWMHTLDWALYNLNGVPDLYQFAGPDWANWNHGSLPACGAGSANPQDWFPSVDLCEWDSDWMDCNNGPVSLGCRHAGEVDGGVSWYEHVISQHYPRGLDFIGNFCRNGRQDFGESGVDQGWPCEW